MDILNSIEALRSTRRAWREAGLSVGFVPTMGNLHDGHLSLLSLARARCDRTICSIYVNPLQFDRAGDLDRYPRTLDEDIDSLKSLGADALFVPDDSMIYPRGMAHATTVDVPGITDILEGAHRSGHFVGVATVVCKLFNLVQPDVAVFGEKDFQQLLVVKRMAEDLNLPVEVVGAPTAREKSGLARSSRNGYLTEQERTHAALIYRELCSCADALRAGERDIIGLERRHTRTLADAGFKPDYFTVRSTLDLETPHADEKPEDWVILVAAQLGKARLIDNLRVATDPGKPENTWHTE